MAFPDGGASGPSSGGWSIEGAEGVLFVQTVDCQADVDGRMERESGERAENRRDRPKTGPIARRGDDGRGRRWRRPGERPSVVRIYPIEPEAAVGDLPKGMIPAVAGRVDPFENAPFARSGRLSGTEGGKGDRSGGRPGGDDSDRDRSALPLDPLVAAPQQEERLVGNDDGNPERRFANAGVEMAGQPEGPAPSAVDGKEGLPLLEAESGAAGNRLPRDSGDLPRDQPDPRGRLDAADRRSARVDRVALRSDRRGGQGRDDGEEKETTERGRGHHEEG